MNQDNYQQMQTLDYQIKQMHKIIESIDAQLLEMNTTIDALKELEKLPNKQELLFPIANGIFAKGILTHNKTLNINIGSDVVVEKTVADTIKMMEVQANEVQNYRIEVNEQLQKFMESMNNLENIN